MKPQPLTEIDQEMTVRAIVPQLIDADRVAGLLGVSKRQLYRLVHAGEFPQSVMGLGRYRRWDARDYAAWIEARKNAGNKRRGRRT
jgi:excisionase family DNA binding protein